MAKSICEYCAVDSDLVTKNGSARKGKGVHIVIERSFGEEISTCEIINNKFVVTPTRKLVSENKVKLCSSCLYTFYCTSGLESETKMDSKFDGGNEMFETNFSVGKGMEKELFFLDEKHLTKEHLSDVFRYGIS